MDNKPNSSSRKARFYRLAAYVVIIALALQFIPFNIHTTLRIAVPNAAQDWLAIEGASSPTFELPLSLGPTAVQASGGLTITKRAVPSSPVAQGSLITYTLRFTNGTGNDLTLILITDTVPADTTCFSYTKPANWNGDQSTCINGESQWGFFDSGSNPFVSGSVEEFTYVVQVNQPLPDGHTIENLASSYGARAILPVSISTAGETNVSHTVIAPEWAIGKTSNPTGTVEAGELIEYIITVTNTGSLTTSGNFLITDVIPADTTFSSSPFTWQAGGGVVTLTVGSTVGIGQLMNVNWFAQVDKPLPPGVIITNTAYGVSGGNVYAGASSTAPVTVTVTSGPLLQISKTANAPTANPGDRITYTIIYTNIGSNDLAATAFITDTIPDNTSYVSSTPVYTSQIGMKQFGWFTPSLPINTPQTIELVVLVDNPLPNGILLTNTVIITSSGVALANGGANEAIVTVDSAPVLKLTKISGPDPVLAGDTLAYTITIKNTGTNTATNVAITDTLDGNLTFSVSNPLTTTSSPPDYSFFYPTLAPSEAQTITISAAVSPTTPHGTILVNNVIATAVETGNVTAVETTTVNAPSFAISKSVTPQTVRAGGKITYTITYTSDGSVDVTGLRITDTLPVSVSSVISSADAAVFVGGTLPTLVFERLAGFTGTEAITIVATVITNTWPTTPVMLTNYVTATIDFPPLQYTGSVQSFGQPDAPATMLLQVVPTTTVVQQNVAITATIRDQYGNLIADGETVTFTTTLAGSSFGSGSSGATGGGVVLNTLTSTAPGTSTVSVQAGSVIQSDVVTFTAALLKLSKTASVDTVSFGNTLVYTVAVSNFGDTTATNVLVTDTLDAETVFVTANPLPVSIMTPTLVFSFANIAPGVTKTIVITADVSLTAPNGYVIANNVSATAVETNSVATAIETTTVSAPAFALSKAVTPTIAVAGQAITYTISYTSDGAVPVNDIRITDTVPLSVTNLAVADNGGNASLVSNTLIFTRPGAFLGSGIITITGNLMQTPWPATAWNLSNHVTGTIANVPTIYTDNALLTASSGPAANIAVTAVPSVTIINTTAAITAEITDLYGNPVVDGTTVVFSSSLAGSSVMPASANTAYGLANASATSTAPGATTIIASAGGISGTMVVTFTESGLLISKSAAPNPVPPGSLLVYTIIVSNSGNSALSNVVITDFLSLETRTQFVSANPSGADVNGNRVFNLGTLSPGLTQTILITVQLISANDGDMLLNLARANADETAFQQASVTVPVNAASLLLSKSVTPNPVLAGELVTYTIAYTNDTAKPIDVRLTDTLPASITAFSIIPGSANEAANNGVTVVFTQANLAAGAGNVIIIVGQVATDPWPAVGANRTNYVTAATSLNLPPLTAQAATEIRPAAPSTMLILANPLSTTADNPIAITAAIEDQYGNPVYNGTQVTFSSSSANTSIASPQPTGNGVAATTVTAINPTTTTATITATVAGNISDHVDVLFTKPPVIITMVYLPLILKAYPPPPVIDLVVDSIAVSPPNPAISQSVIITVTIRNTGTTATKDQFWVDLYITPEPITPTVNQPWNDWIDQGGTGVAWIAPGIGAGEVITLTNLLPNDYSKGYQNPATDCKSYSHFTPETVGACTWTGNSNTFVTTGTYYISSYVDSFGDDTSPDPKRGNIMEINEHNNLYPTPVMVNVSGNTKKYDTILTPSHFAPFAPGQKRSPFTNTGE